MGKWNIRSLLDKRQGHFFLSMYPISPFEEAHPDSHFGGKGKYHLSCAWKGTKLLMPSGCSRNLTSHYIKQGRVDPDYQELRIDSQESVSQTF